MVTGGVFLREVAALALDGVDVQDDRLLELLRAAQRLYKRGDVVPVDGAEIVEAEILEEVRMVEQLAEGRLGVGDHVAQLPADDGDLLQRVLHPVFQI